MKTKLVTLSVLSAAVYAVGLQAQTVEATPPAPQAPAMAPAASPAPNQVIYAARLPSATELTNVAAAQGLTVERIVQTASQVTVVYRYANGQTNTVAYLVLPGANGAAAQVQVVTPTSPPPAMVYEPAPRVIYYDGYGPGYYGYAGPGYWYPPVSIGLGFGFRGGGFRGGFHHGR